MKEPNTQWMGAQGYEWWTLDFAKDKFTDNENELIIKINDCFIVRAFTTKKWYDYYWSEIHINNLFYKKSCEHIDEDLYWLLDHLDKIVFVQNIKNNKIKTMSKKRFEKKKDKILSKPNIKIFTV